MARPLRIEFPEAIYHITARGNERKSIFLDDKDYVKFLVYLSDSVKVFRLKIFGYVLMPNHYHLVLQTVDANLSRVMHQLNTAYTVYFNRKYSRVGHLFQGRYKALLIQKNPYLLEVSRYVHLNAVRARLINDPYQYRWCSYQYYVGRGKIPEWLDTNFIIEMLSKNTKKQKHIYKEFVEGGIFESRNPFDKVYAQTILGDEDFIDKVMDRLDLEKNQEIPATKEFCNKLSFRQILHGVCEVTKKSEEAVIKGGRFSLERKILIYLLRTRTSMSLQEIGRNFGVSYSAVSQTKKAFEQRLQQDEKLENIVERINGILES